MSVQQSVVNNVGVLALITALGLLVLTYKGLSAAALAIFLILHPEITFALFINAGSFKTYEQLQLPFDATLVLGSLVALSITLSLFRSRFSNLTETISNSIGLIIPYYLLALIMMAGLIYTPSPTYGMDKFLRFITFTALACLGPIFILREEKNIKVFFYTFIAFASAMCINAIATQSITVGTWRFNSAFGSNYLAFGRVTGFAAITLLGLLVTSKTLSPKYIVWTGLFFLNLFGLLSSGGRGPVIAFTSVIVFAWLSMVIFSSSKMKSILIGGATAVAMLCFIVIFKEYFYTLFTRIDEFSDERINASREVDITYAMNALNLYALSPLIGVGTGGFDDVARHQERPATFYTSHEPKEGLYPHNLILEIFCENGIIALAIFILLLIKVYKRFREVFSSCNELKPVTYIVLGLTCFMFINSLFSADINGNRILFTCFGILYAINNICKHRNHAVEV
jgi:O-antigen ligase